MQLIPNSARTLPHFLSSPSQATQASLTMTSGSNGSISGVEAAIERLTKTGSRGILIVGIFSSNSCLRRKTVYGRLAKKFPEKAYKYVAEIIYEETWITLDTFTFMSKWDELERGFNSWVRARGAPMDVFLENGGVVRHADFIEGNESSLCALFDMPHYDPDQNPTDAPEVFDAPVSPVNGNENGNE